jgi:hypothetical protein
MSNYSGKTQPAHILGDVIGPITIDESRVWAVRVKNDLSPSGYTILHVPAQYVVVGAALENLYEENYADEYNEYLNNYCEGVLP